MFGLGAVELIVILVIVLLLFGAGRVTGVMKDLGKGVTAFKSGLKEDNSEQTEGITGKDAGTKRKKDTKGGK